MCNFQFVGLLIDRKHLVLFGRCTVYQIQRGKVCKHIGEVIGQTPVELLHYKNLNIPTIYCNI